MSQTLTNQSCEHCGGRHHIQDCRQVPHFTNWEESQVYVERLKRVGIWTGIRVKSLTPVRHVPNALSEMDSHGYFGKG